jgi:general secretion pathway protein G
MKIQSIKKGFTLIELLVVITIIGILATGGVSVFTTQLQGARDSTRIGDMKLMETGVHQYFNDQGTYPPEATFT